MLINTERLFELSSNPLLPSSGDRCLIACVSLYSLMTSVMPRILIFTDVREIVTYLTSVWLRFVQFSRLPKKAKWRHTVAFVFAYLAWSNADSRCSNKNKTGVIKISVEGTGIRGKKACCVGRRVQQDCLISDVIEINIQTTTESYFLQWVQSGYFRRHRKCRNR